MVVDPGVFVSALINPTGPPGRIVQAIRVDQVVAVVCPHLLEELVQVLLRPKFRPYASLIEVSAFLKIIADRAEHWPDPDDVPALCRDPNDDYLLALAVQAGAAHLVSGDADLLSLRAAGPAIMSPKEFTTASSL